MFKNLFTILAFLLLIGCAVKEQPKRSVYPEVSKGIYAETEGKGSAPYFCHTDEVCGVPGRSVHPLPFGALIEEHESFEVLISSCAGGITR